MGYEKGKSAAKRDARMQGRDNKRQGTIDYRDYRFVHIDLREDEKRELRSIEYSLEGITAWMDECYRAGYTGKFKSDSGRGTIHFTLSCDNPEAPNAGLRLSGFGQSSAAALVSCWYKDTVICADRDWRQAEHERGGDTLDIG